jgi:CIC family chloride channel protein
MKEAYVPVPTRPLQEIAVLSKFKVKDIMTKNLETISPDSSVNQLLDFMAKHHHTGYPVVDENGDLVGIVVLDDVAKVEKEKRNDVLIQDIMWKNPTTIQPEELALDAFKKMRMYDLNRIAVVDKNNPKKIVGILTKSDLRYILSSQL